MDYMLFAVVIAFGPSALLVGWALWVYFTKPDHDDFLERREDWGAQ